ncbi:hypothetical protein F2Q69_00028483 [Brassica cretica]|uniref:Uncharacterized protein n=1 Tax=Brassica cretica TaxID=69181 RepID=A0A8S9SBA2_BRACR|nr:hypothetical protein F2Q69_00028483 [Brassica cretica]
MVLISVPTLIPASLVAKAYSPSPILLPLVLELSLTFSFCIFDQLKRIHVYDSEKFIIPSFSQIPNNPRIWIPINLCPQYNERFELQDSAFWKPARMTAYETWIGIPVSTRGAIINPCFSRNSLLVDRGADEPSNDLSFEIFEQELAERYCLGSVDPSYVRTSTLGLQMGFESALHVGSDFRIHWFENGFLGGSLPRRRVEGLFRRLFLVKG